MCLYSIPSFIEQFIIVSFGEQMIHWLYNISIRLYSAIVTIASFFNLQAKLWVKGRRNLFSRMENDFKRKKTDDKVFWIHCASLGEFEQGRPLIEALKLKSPELKILLTFFSPSGYEVQKEYVQADYVYYLPIDTPKNTKRFISIVKPSAAFFIKYEFWYNYLIELKKNNIPTYLVSGIFRTNQYFFKSYGKWFRNNLACFTHFFLQTDESQILLESIKYKNTTVSGDTRFDRVKEIAKRAKKFPLIEEFKKDYKLIVAGSTWYEDEKILSQLNSPSYKLIIAPHEVDDVHVSSIISLFAQVNEQAICFSKANSEQVKNAKVMIIDSIGVLSSLYQYARIAYVGGGFGKGIHNILEPATFGVPIIFGPHFEKFNEAKELVRLGGAFPISTIDELGETVTMFESEEILENTSHVSQKYVNNHVGATERILSKILL